MTDGGSGCFLEMFAQKDFLFLPLPPIDESLGLGSFLEETEPVSPGLCRVGAGLAGCFISIFSCVGAQAQQCRLVQSVFAASLTGVGLGLLTSALVFKAGSGSEASAQELSKGGVYGATAGASFGLLGFALDLPICRERWIEGRLSKSRPRLDSGLQPLRPIIEWARRELPRGSGDGDRVVYDLGRVSLGVNVSYLF